MKSTTLCQRMEYSHMSRSRSQRKSTGLPHTDTRSKLLQAEINREWPGNFHALWPRDRILYKSCRLSFNMHANIWPTSSSTSAQSLQHQMNTASWRTRAVTKAWSLTKTTVPIAQHCEKTDLPWTNLPLPSASCFLGQRLSKSVSENTKLFNDAALGTPNHRQAQDLPRRHRPSAQRNRSKPMKQRPSQKFIMHIW